jgi:hypothetical protein
MSIQAQLVVWMRRAVSRAADVCAGATLAVEARAPRHGRSSGYIARNVNQNTQQEYNDEYQTPKSKKVISHQSSS